MTLLSALPNWNAIHPVVVHFPIALLLVAPLFIVAGALWPKRTNLTLLACALILMTLGTAGTFVAQSTGEAAARATVQAPALEAMIEQHEDLAEATGWVFLSLTAIFAAMLYGLALVQKRGQPAIARYLPVIYVVLYMSGAVLLIQTAHRGGQLVHQFGVHATIPSEASSTASLH